MGKRPLILVSPSIETKGIEFSDMSLSLSLPYERALLNAGMLPWPVLSLPSRQLIAECVRRADGFLLTGGEDVNPVLYDPQMPHPLRRKCILTPDGGARDLRRLFDFSSPPGGGRARRGGWGGRLVVAALRGPRPVWWGSSA